MNIREDITRVCKEHSLKGYLNKDPHYSYGYIILNEIMGYMRRGYIVNNAAYPNDKQYFETPVGGTVILYIQDDGYTYYTSLQYKRGKNGTGCEALKGLTELTLETLTRAAQEGMNFARKLGADLYPTVDDWYKEFWNKDGLEEIT